MIAILSDDGWFRANLDEGEAGIDLSIWELLPRSNGRMRRIHTEQLDCPMHLALDRVHDAINAMKPEFKTWAMRGRRPAIL